MGWNISQQRIWWYLIFTMEYQALLPKNSDNSIVFSPSLVLMERIPQTNLACYSYDFKEQADNSVSCPSVKIILLLFRVAIKVVYFQNSIKQAWWKGRIIILHIRANNTYTWVTRYLNKKGEKKRKHKQVDLWPQEELCDPRHGLTTGFILDLWRRQLLTDWGHNVCIAAVSFTPLVLFFSRFYLLFSGPAECASSDTTLVVILVIFLKKTKTKTKQNSKSHVSIGLVRSDFTAMMVHYHVVSFSHCLQLDLFDAGRTYCCQKYIQKLGNPA